MSADELAILRQYYATEKMSELIMRFPGRNAQSLRKMACRLGIKRRRKGDGWLLDDNIIAHLTESERGYLAGIIDGEGSISFSRLKLSNIYSLHIAIAMTDLAVIDWLMQKVPQGSYWIAYPKNRPSWLPLYRWTLTTNASIALLRELSPYLVGKRTEAELLKDGWHHLSPSGRFELHSKIRSFKTKGVKSSKPPPYLVA